MEENEKLNAEVIAVLPNKVKISVDDLENFQLAEEKLKVGSYLRIADNDNAVLIAIIENFNIEVGVSQSGEASRKYILEANPYDAEKVLNVASYAHMYVFEFDGKIIGTGSISSFWGSETESILLSIFVLPEFHGKGVGRKIINILETDEFYVRASRIEIPASITATEFYRKFGYDYKNGVKELDNEHHYRLEKFKEAGLK